MLRLTVSALALALLSGTGAVAVAVAQQQQQQQPAQAQQQPAQAQQQPAGDPVVAIVNGSEIRRSELEAAQGRLPEQYRQVPLPMIYDPLLDQLISSKLLAATAKERKLQDEPEVQAEIARARDDVLRNSLIENAIEAGSTEERLKAAYEAAKSQPGFASEQTRAMHILVGSEAEAKDIIAQLQKGADFAELAKSKSTDPSAKENAGDLGYFGRDDMVPEFTEAASKIQPGTVGEKPVQSQFGWHVIKVVDRRTAVPTFDDKEPEIRQQVAREIVNQLVTDARGGAKIQRFNLDGTPQAADAGAGAAAPKAN